MCGGGGSKGPSSADRRKEAERQAAAQQQQQAQFEAAQAESARIAAENAAQSQAQFDAQMAATNARNAQNLATQQANFDQTMAAQQEQAAAAQAHSEKMLNTQIMENKRIALDAEKAANKARGMQAVNSNEGPKVKRKKAGAKRQASSGTQQLTNPLSIALSTGGGGKSGGLSIGGGKG